MHKHTTTWNRNRRTKFFVLAALVKAADSRPRLCAPPPEPLPSGLRVGFLVGHRGCFNYGTEGKTLTGEKNLQRSRPLQSALNQSFRQWVFDILL